MNDKKIHFYIPAFNGGGAENAIIRLLNYWHDAGRSVALIVNQMTGPLIGRLNPKVPVYVLGSSHSLANIPRLTRHLRNHRPDLLVTALLSPNVAGVIASRISGSHCPVVCLVRNHTSQELREHSFVRHVIIKPLLSYSYARAAAIGCVSRDVSQDMSELFGIDQKRLFNTYNPVPDSCFEAATRPADMPDDGDPVFLAIGRLVRQKDYPTMITAFAKLQKKHRSHLVILGEGPERHTIQTMVQKQYIADRVHLLGYRQSPQDYLCHCDGFLLFSLFEGFPNVIVEALAAGASIVATDAPGGTSDILADGTFGHLIPLRDANAAANAMANVLQNPLTRHQQIHRAMDFSLPTVADRYDQLFQLAFDKTDRVQELVPA
ncbi:glycosyltransferase [Parasulfitobacter algicola]|uniref:Glycosyltransferase n=1 Tax=Parasulfitobacter algicola TaxID=2614809 RepID=A0ABX2ILV7_9RHOB|nr:glycosyltransferase [Sulfitobacter algicola]NSX53866.1 glycosyltransferase [Sulfitobacter algicola]